MSTQLEEQILAQLNEIATRIRTPAEQARFEAVMTRLLESDNAEERWIATGIPHAQNSVSAIEDEWVADLLEYVG